MGGRRGTGHSGGAHPAAPRVRLLARRLTVALALAPLAVMWIGVGGTGEESAVLTSLAQAAVQLPPPAAPPPGTTPPAAVTASPGAAPQATSTPARRTTMAPSTTLARTKAVVAAGATGKAPTGLTRPAEQFRDLTYATLSPDQRLDLYLPRRVGKAVPLVVEIHGGAFMGGRRSEAGARISSLVARGYAVASIDYRLSSQAPFPAGLKDVKAAVRWLRASAPRYGIDPARFAAWGDSAGGYFAAMLGATSGLKTPLDDAALGNPRVSSSVQAVVDFYGPTNFLTMDRQAVNPGGCPQAPQRHDEARSPESLWLGAPVQSVPSLARSASPITYLKTSSTPPPFFVAHGTADCQVPYGQTTELVAALRARGTTNRTYLLHGVGHGSPEFDRQLSPRVLAFLDATLHRA